jgi:hypothetical protein
MYMLCLAAFFSKRSTKDRIFIIKGDNENTPVFTNNKTKAEDRRLMLAFKGGILQDQQAVLKG